MKVTTSAENSKFKSWIKLHQKKYRTKEQKFLIEGPHLIEEAIFANVVEEIILCEGVRFETNLPTTTLKKQLFEKLAQTVTSTGIMAQCLIKPQDINAYNRVLLVDGVQDPGNLGTLVRSALAFGFDGVFLSEDTVDLYNEKVVRATQGAIFRLPVVRKNLLEVASLIQDEGGRIYATSLNAESKFIHEVKPSPNMAFIVGNEGAGVRDELVAMSDEVVIIAMSEAVESLNVGVAGSILMHYFNGL